jgi:hypothetical protein
MLKGLEVFEPSRHVPDVSKPHSKDEMGSFDMIVDGQLFVGELVSVQHVPR